MYGIDKTIPVTDKEKRGRPKTYPFAEMGNSESFFIELENQDKSDKNFRAQAEEQKLRVMSAFYMYKKRHGRPVRLICRPDSKNGVAGLRFSLFNVDIREHRKRVPLTSLLFPHIEKEGDFVDLEFDEDKEMSARSRLSTAFRKRASQKTIKDQKSGVLQENPIFGKTCRVNKVNTSGEKITLRVTCVSPNDKAPVIVERPAPEREIVSE